MIGQLLGGRYRVRQPLGGGGMASVYLAQDEALDRLVAIKTLRPEFVDDDEFVKRFQMEARAAASLSHPNIVAIYDVGQIEDGLDYIVMEYVDGQTVKESIKSEGPLPADTAVDMALQALAALDHAHEHGVIHRDIKPQNILLTGTGRVKVADFGIARAVGTHTLAEAGPIMGSAHYVSPEQVSGRTTCPRTDLYSLGVVLFEMLTGVVPYDGDSMVAVAMQHLQAEPPAPSQLAPSVSATLDEIILRALAKDPRQRYPSAAVMAADLGNYRDLTPDQVWTLPAADATINLSALGLDQVNGRNGGAGDGQPSSPVPSPGAPVTTAVSAADTATAVPASATAQPQSRSHPRSRQTPARRAARRRRSFVIWVLVLIGFGGGLGFAGQALGSWLSPPLVAVPSLAEMDQAAAREELRRGGVELKVVAERHDDRVDAGLVLEQSPAAGDSIRRGGVVNVIMSLGAQLVPGGMIDLLGETTAAADLRLRQLGLPVEHVYIHHYDVPEGKIIDQQPRPATPVKTGTNVTLIVSQGPGGGPQVLPDLRGRSLADARAALQALNLRVGEITAADSDYPAEVIAGHEPVAGTTVRSGEEILLTVSRGNGTAPNEKMYLVALPAEPDSQQVLVRVIDERGERLVHNDRHDGAASFQVPVHWYGGDAVVTVESNGQLLAVEEL